MLFAIMMDNANRCWTFWMLLVLLSLSLLLLLQPQPGSSFSTTTKYRYCKHHYHHLKLQRQRTTNNPPSHLLFNTEEHNNENEVHHNDIVDPINEITNNSNTNSNTMNDDDILSIKRRDFMTIFASSMTLMTSLSHATAAAAVSAAAILEPAAPSSSSSVTTAVVNKYAAPLAFSSIRRYRQVTLSNNGLRVLLVSDKSSMNAKAYAASTQQQQQVALIIHGAGQFADPNDLPGCAHLMEHLCLCSTSMSAYSSLRRGLLLDVLPLQQQRDFEDWLSDRDGASNGYTAYDHVCFHFSCPLSSSLDASSAASSGSLSNSGGAVFQEALERFAGLFEAQAVERVCASTEILKREVRRVNSEIDFDTVTSQAYYLTKDFVNPEHPFSKFSMGSYDTLERIPKELAQQQPQRPTVGQRLWDFFQRHYQPQQATLCVIGPQDLRTLERWVAPFSTILAKRRQQDQIVMPFNMFAPPDYISRDNDADEDDDDDDDNMRRVLGTTGRRPRVVPSYPGGFLQGTRLKTLVLYRKPQPGDKEEGETLTFQWILNLDYAMMQKQQRQTQTTLAAATTQKGKTTSTTIVTGTHMAFFLSQIFSRKLHFFLQRRGWVPANNGFPRVTLPVDVSAFQLVKLEIRLTMEGFLNRPAVVAAVYDTLDALFTTSRGSRGGGGKKFVISRELVTQWMSMAKLHGYILASRPSDAVELAIDSLLYDQDYIDDDGLFMGGGGVVDDSGDYWGSWYRFPSPEDRSAVTLLRNHLEDTLSMMRDPNNAVVICTAGNRAITKSNLSMPLQSTRRTWNRDPVTGARFLFDDMFRLTTSRVEELVLSRLVNREELLYPVLNPLIPIILRPAREANVEMTRNKIVSPKTTFTKLYSTIQEEIEGRRSSALDFWISQSSKKTMRAESEWTILKVKDGEGLPLPRSPPEPSCRSVFVLQFLSSRPARAGLRQAAQGELWRISFDFDKSVVDLAAELGAPAGCFYDLSFNKYGCRLAFMGLSQNIQSYARRISRRLVEHQFNLLAGQEIFQREITATAVANARRARGLSQQRRRRIVSSIRQSTAYEAAAEGIAFLRSCKGAICFSQGDLLPMETEELVQDLRQIFSSVIGGEQRNSMPADPSLEDIIYPPTWKPRNASPCSIPGVPLISDACGRVRR